MRRKTKYGIAIALIICALIAGRLYLSTWAVKYVNARLSELNGYDGSIQDLDIVLWRGAYQIEGLQIYKTKGGLKEPFVAADTVDLSVEWGALFHGRIVAKADVENIDFNFALNQTGTGNNWARFIDKLSPLDINRITVHGGKVAYRDHRAKPDVNVYIEDINATVTNLRNVEAQEEALPSQLDVSGTSIGQGKLGLQGRMNIMQAVPDFDIDLQLQNASLPAFNNFTKAAANVEFAKGNASVFAELAAAKGHLEGYIKFIANRVAVKAPDPLHDGIIDALWTAAATAFVEIFKNHPRDQFALRIPIKGSINNPQEDGWAAFFSIFSNAFKKAFAKNNDGSISFINALQKSDE